MLRRTTVAVAKIARSSGGAGTIPASSAFSAAPRAIDGHPSPSLGKSSAMLRRSSRAVLPLLVVLATSSLVFAEPDAPRLGYFLTPTQWELMPTLLAQEEARQADLAAMRAKHAPPLARESIRRGSPTAQGPGPDA